MPPSREIEIRYTLTLSQFMAAYAEHWKAHRQSTRIQILMGAIGVGVGLATMKIVLWPAISIALIVVGSIVWMIPLIRYVLYRRAFHESKKYTQDIHVVFSHAGIHVDSAEGTSDLKWGFYSKYLDTRDYVLLYVTRHSFSVIPKSALASSEATRQLVDLIDAHLERVR